MQQKIVSRQCVIYFRRWSRKKYATFASLGRTVVIAHVSNRIADASLRKFNPFGAILSAGTSCYTADVDTDEDDIRMSELIFPDSVLRSQYGAVIPPTVWNNIAVSSRMAGTIDNQILYLFSDTMGCTH